jgi:hypothetical protein
MLGFGCSGRTSVAVEVVDDDFDVFVGGFAGGFELDGAGAGT